MTHLNTLIPSEDLASALQARHVTRKQHPHLPLSIYTYAPVCQYENLWNDITMRCRGLVVDDESGLIVALPFPKIFVTTMHNHGLPFAPPLPAEPFEVLEKADGSLAIIYHYQGKWHAASKGSFISTQAQWAQAVLDRADTSLLDPTLTYLAEATSWAHPHSVRDCPCEGCENLDAWTLSKPEYAADVDLRFICLAPAEDDEPCTLVLHNQPMAIIRAEAVAHAKTATEKPPEAVYSLARPDGRHHRRRHRVHHFSRCHPSPE